MFLSNVYQFLPTELHHVNGPSPLFPLQFNCLHDATELLENDKEGSAIRGRPKPKINFRPRPP